MRKPSRINEMGKTRCTRAHTKWNRSQRKREREKLAEAKKRTRKTKNTRRNSILMQLIGAVKRKPTKKKKISTRSYSHSYTARVTHVLPDDERKTEKNASSKTYAPTADSKFNRFQVDVTRAYAVASLSMFPPCEFHRNFLCAWCLTLIPFPFQHGTTRCFFSVHIQVGFERCLSCVCAFTARLRRRWKCVFLSELTTHNIFFLSRFVFFFYYFHLSSRFVQQCLHTASVV